jgi:hypothetical protein
MSPRPWSLIAKEGTSMCPFPVLLSRGLGILLALVMTTMAHSQQITVARARQEKAPPPRDAEPPPGSVHRMVILEGPNRRVHYITTGNLTARDRQVAYDLERAENQLTYVHDLQRLKQQYVNSERILEPQRRAIQENLYGRYLQYSTYGAAYSSSGYGGFGYVGGYYGYPYGYYPFFNNGWGWGWGYGYGYPGGIYSSLGSTSYSEVHSLQYGMGDEGRMKDALVQVIAHESSPDHAAAAVRDYDAAIARAAASPVLSRDLGLPKIVPPAPSPEPTFPKGGKATIWLGNDKYVGTITDDRPGWVVLQTDKAEVTVRKSEITRSEVSKP